MFVSSGAGSILCFYRQVLAVFSLVIVSCWQYFVLLSLGAGSILCCRQVISIFNIVTHQVVR